MSIYQDSSRPIDERVEDLIQRMTLTEKIGQLNQRLYGWEAYEKTEKGFELTDTFKQEVERWGGIGLLYGLFRADPWSKRTYKNGVTAAESPKLANQIQNYIKKNTRLGIPVLLSEECTHGHQALDGTVIPANIGVGATWNADLIECMYSHIAKEIRLRGAHLGLISTLDILRDPRWGRAEECISEDPHLAARMTVAVVRGLQGRGSEDLKRSDKIGSVLKHFCAQGAGEGGINAAPALIGERELRDIHLPGMKAGVEAGAIGCMAAYNEIDGIPCHANKRILTGILRNEWQYKGVVMADGLAVDRLKMQTGSYEKAAAVAIDAGVDVSLWDYSYSKLEEAVKQGLVSEQIIDRSVRRILKLKFLLGLFEQRFTDESKISITVGNVKIRRKNLQVARESVVLLKNQNNTLPLSPSIKKLAVIGPNADNLYNQLGDYTATQRQGKGVTVLSGLRKKAPAHMEIAYAKGCGIRDESMDGFQEAIEIARDSEIIVAVVGGSSARNFDIQFDSNGAAILGNRPVDMDCGEGVDVADLKLGGVQEELISELARLGKPLIGIVIQGRPYAIGSLVKMCQAVLCGWYPGEEGGEALAEILFGSVNPSGKLPVSIPRSSSQLPVYYNRKDLGGLPRYRDMVSQPLFPFGYGLSYTTFIYSDIQSSTKSISISALEAGEKVRLQVIIENTGNMRGAEVVQLYRYKVESSVTQRVRELKAFRKVDLEPQTKKTVTFFIGIEELSIWDRDMNFCVEPGIFKWFIGTDSTTRNSITLHVTE